MKIIIDTNVLVSAALVGKKPEEVVLFVVNNEKYEWVVSEEILAEYQEVLSRRKLNLTAEKKQRWFDIIEESANLVDVSVEIDFPRDRKDAKFLACALATNADFLITGDRDFSEAQLLVPAVIISVSMFKELVIDAPPDYY